MCALEHIPCEPNVDCFLGWIASAMSSAVVFLCQARLARLQALENVPCLWHRSRDMRWLDEQQLKCPKKVALPGARTRTEGQWLQKSRSGVLLQVGSELWFASAFTETGKGQYNN